MVYKPLPLALPVRVGVGGGVRAPSGPFCAGLRLASSGCWRERQLGAGGFLLIWN